VSPAGNQHEPPDVEQTVSLAPAAATPSATSVHDTPQDFSCGRYWDVAAWELSIWPTTKRSSARVAVKLLRERYAGRCGGDSAAARRFLGEAKITARCSTLAFRGVSSGSLPQRLPFLAMKLIRGETLDKLLAAKSP